MSQDEFVSRLQKAGTGMGSAIPQNRKVMGVPEVEVREEPNSEVVADLVMAAVSANWVAPGMPPGVAKDAGNAERWLLQPAITNAMRQGWHDEMQKAAEEKVDAELEAELESSGATTERLLPALDPSDPVYDAMRDHERRKQIESQVAELSFEDLVFHGYATQIVPLRVATQTTPAFSITLRTLLTQHGLWLEHLLSKLPDTGVYHIRHYWGLMQVAACLEALNGKPLRTEAGLDLDLTKYWNPDDDKHFEGFQNAMKERMKILARMPQPLSDDLIVQNAWFALRVRKVFIGDVMRKVGNS